MWLQLILLGVVSLLIYTFFLKGKKDFWKQYGVRQVDHSTVKDNILVFLGKKTLSDYDEVVYKEMGSEKICGMVQMGAPFLIVKDLEIVKKVLIKDFDHFVDRRTFGETKSQPILEKMIGNLKGDRWKGVRASLSPTFTTGKIRRMMECFNHVGHEWVDHFNQEIKKNGRGEVEVQVVQEATNFAVDVICSAVFGLGVGTVKNPNSPFLLMTKKLNKIDMKQMIKFGLVINFPKFADFLRLHLFNQEALDFFESILSQGLKARMEGKEKKNDFLQLIAEARKGTLKAQGADELSSFEKEAMLNNGVEAEKKNYLDDDSIAIAQMIGFFFAGFSTVSNFVGFMLYSLALNQECQDKLREEIDKDLFKNGKRDADYDDLNKLNYLEMCMCEALRKFPPLGRLERKCTKDYFDSEYNFRVPKDAFVAVPIQAIHNDPQFYEYPDKFYPEHFTSENKANRSPYAYLPFGSGMRFALVETKAAIAHLVHNFKISPSKNTPVPMKTKPVGFGVQLPDDLELLLTPVQK